MANKKTATNKKKDSESTNFLSMTGLFAAGSKPGITEGFRRLSIFLAVAVLAYAFPLIHDFTAAMYDDLGVAVSGVFYVIGVFGAITLFLLTVAAVRSLGWVVSGFFGDK